MKKIFTMLAAVLLITGAVSAQTTKPAKDKPASKMTSATAKTTTKTTVATATPAKPAAGGTPIKKDGTPDMRYKANKDAAKTKPAGPAKRDGTPDMRYKANKRNS